MCVILWAKKKGMGKYREKVDPRRMDSVRVSKNDQGMFSQCREIVLKLVDEFGKNDLSQE